MQLHKPDVVAAATTILDDYGIADLSMRRLARELNVSPSALYWHFANKQQLLGAVADRVLAPACADPGPGSWQWRIQTVGERLRDALLSHTDGAELVSASLAAGQSQAATEIVALLAAAATAAGVPLDQAEQVGRTVVYYVLGFTADEQSRLQWDAAGAAEISSDADPGSAFAFGLGLLIDGLAMRAGITVG
ncbi:TetR/AcrR family transcriptional regulator C-terminal domain-containing protein [Mycolicibacter longobardus]|uniref:TetR family transcriptional regulator n=1 Tax=Mycolicibacter longobardus TaxID=1108812 RepID=A0A1X1YLX5_9MYCO|nr:TetR/AcrR family transcriptional regulator C-terminal domain-containing protein [Mycolicibacter longobardus]MCV7384580.1 TetR/AcrR family transcriptional regulator C-terminal domain-containing protein [Mycolicibacter longobardus]ORW12025.1 TetR family transcriptional regulator [Mycolicibacter longobardus]